MWYVIEWHSPHNPSETFRIQATDALMAKVRIVNHLRKQNVHYAETEQMQIVSETRCYPPSWMPI